MDIQEKYNEWHTATSTYFENPLDFQWYRTTLRLLPDLNGLDVLEIGCGRGAFSRLLIEKYPSIRLTAIDISEVAISEAKSPASTIQFAVGNAESLEFPDQSFDFIFSCETLEHLPHPVRMTKEIFRLLKPGGKFIITTENYFNGMMLMWLKTWVLKKPFDSGSGEQPHENFFLFFGVAGLIRKGGLKLNHTESNHFQWLLLPGLDPKRLCTQDFKNPLLKRIFRPFGRHYTFCGYKPK
jgi:SAM-dependent methyltransferase